MGIFLMFYAAIFVAACSGGGFQGKNASGPSQGNKVGFDSDSVRSQLEDLDIKDATALKEACENAGELPQLKAPLVFPERRECSWNIAPNLDRRDAFVQAFEKTDQIVELPPNSVICSMNIKSPDTTSLHYDDFLFLTLENYVIFGTNQLITNYLDRDENLYLWQFDKIKGQPIRNFEASRFCLAANNRCQLPPHDQTGPVALDINTEESAPLALKVAEGSQKINFSLVATGDNDDRDCYHTALNLEVAIEYLTLN
ncbi:MAG: hypothetical protein ACOH5I_10765 [Oligoflexus sp.]